MLPGHRFVRGNHPHVPQALAVDPRSMCARQGDFVGEAHLGDRRFRTSGYDWRPRSSCRKTTLAGSSKNILPPSRVMVLPGRRCGFGKFASFRGTNSSLQLMWEAHQAERWMFGAPSFVVRSSRQRDALCLLGAGRGILICRCTAPARSARASPGRACFVRSCAKRASLRPNSPPAFEP